MLNAHSIKKSYTQANTIIQVLKGCSATFERGKSYAITGPSGSGKSTLLHILAGLEVPDQGSVLFNNQDISLLSPNQRAQFLNSSIGLVFQLPYLIAEFCAIENVMIKGLIQGLDLKECQDRAYVILDKVGLADKASHKSLSLSGGEQQRIAIARALFNKPAFLLADEPTGNLDMETGRRIVNLLLAAQREWNMGIIVSSHDAYIAQRMEKILRLDHGVII
jgi:ABC-type lipoprotein export system ATPase subunit